MTKLAKRFGRKQFKDCCGKGCKKCEIAQAYVAELGRAKGLEKLGEDRKAALKKRGAKKTRKAKKKAKA